ncbi:MAG: DUF6602 domain-containing protein [Candidatus Bathyarchaeia archaeon]
MTKSQKKSEKNRSLIKQHTSAIIKGFIAEAKAIKNLSHSSEKGRLRELFTSKILSKFLTNQFGIGTGVIINQKGEQSEEIDIIVYDNRILPPFIEEQKVGVYPAECVLGVIQVRSWIDKDTIKKYAKSAQTLYENVYNPACSIYHDYDKMRPFYSLVGFYDRGIFEGASQKDILKWMMENAKPLLGVCLVDKFSWLNVVVPEGSLKMVDEYNEETKAFVAVLLDNIRTYSQMRYLSLANHVDWLSIYTRDQGSLF